MKLAAVLLALLPAPEEADGRFFVRPETVAVGEPFQLVLEVSHDGGDASIDAAEEPEPDASWVVLESTREAAVPDGRQPGRFLTRRVWIVASLDHGTRHVADAFRAPFEAVGVHIDEAPGPIEVLGVLGEGEDEPRPLQGFPGSFGADVDAEVASMPWWPIGLGAAALSFVLVWLWSRRRRGPAAMLARSPLEQLDELRTEAASAPTAVRESHFELARLVRSATDRALARDERHGLTDEEWLAALQGDADLGADAKDELTRVLDRCTTAKYGGHRPTEWALEETFAGARRLFEAVAAGSSTDSTGKTGAAR